MVSILMFQSLNHTETQDDVNDQIIQNSYTDAVVWMISSNDTVVIVNSFFLQQADACPIDLLVYV
jgi:hypothetical protein